MQLPEPNDTIEDNEVVSFLTKNRQLAEPTFKYNLSFFIFTFFFFIWIKNNRIIAILNTGGIAAL